MEGYGPSSYGDRFADVYDDWYAAVSDVDATVAALLRLAGGGAVLELGVGTGRLAIPLAGAGAGAGVKVTGIDSSAAMLDVLRAKPGADLVDLRLGDMVDDMPPGRFDLVFVAYNTIFNLPDEARQAACFRAAADRLAPGGRFVVEAFVPDDPPRQGTAVTLRSMTVDRVVLSVSVHHPAEQLAEGQFVELTESGGIHLRPWAIRYAAPPELDAMGAAAGLLLEHRWSGFGEGDFRDGDERHVSVWRAG
ncbi:MAG: class I SAM-dependent DNA methyltransferase [Ilumatobacteraceae bacterium]